MADLWLLLWSTDRLHLKPYHDQKPFNFSFINRAFLIRRGGNASVSIVNSLFCIFLN